MKEFKIVKGNLELTSLILASVAFFLPQSKQAFLADFKRTLRDGVDIEIERVASISQVKQEKSRYLLSEVMRSYIRYAT